MTSADDISDLIQERLHRSGAKAVAAVEAAAWLDKAGVLKDSPSRPGKPLRELLRAGQIRGGEQRPPSPNGRWFITTLAASGVSNDQQTPIGEVLDGLAIHPLAHGEHALEAFILIKVREADGDIGWSFRTTSAPNREELLGALTVQVDLLRQELRDDWRVD